MRQIPIGTCIPGNHFEKWAPVLIDKGFECFAVNFHMSFGEVDITKLAVKVREIVDESGISISSLGFYSNPLQYEAHAQLLENCIDIADAFGTKTISTFAGALEGKSVEESMPVFKKVFRELTKRAEDKGVKIAIENCPMGGTWRSCTCNIGFNPRAWEMMFDAVPSEALGLEWEPTHQMCQLIDPIPNLRTFANKVVHIHGKDATVNHDIIAEQGIIGPSETVDSRFPGLGDTDWRRIFAILHGVNFQGSVSIEGYHDVYFNDEWEMTGQIHALNYLKWCRGGSFINNPW